MIVLFSFLLALGIVVDDAIVVIENAHRIFHEEKLPIKEAVKKATREVFLPVLTGTTTSSTAVLKIVGIEPIPGNTLGAYVRFMVLFNSAELLRPTAGI